MTTTSSTSRSSGKLAGFLVLGLFVALLIAGVASYYASSSPDGLEKVAGDYGLDANVQDSAVADSPLADYAVTGVENERMSVGLAGVIGVALTFVVAGGLFVLVRRRGGDDSTTTG